MGVENFHKKNPSPVWLRRGAFAGLVYRGTLGEQTGKELEGFHRDFPDPATIGESGNGANNLFPLLIRALDVSLLRAGRHVFDARHLLTESRFEGVRDDHPQHLDSGVLLIGKFAFIHTDTAILADDDALTEVEEVNGLFNVSLFL